ncbi:hypothetical protein ABZ439_23825 [Streptomyces sp. NPDC005840]|uniref:hypothetical protein n=1 Tax=Streptomyces sp. NPDC005840 TaxID=3157072 RepID=UPI0033DCF04B
MERANEPTGTALELLVHGVGGTTPEKMLDDPRTVRITGDDTAAVFRRAEDVDAEDTPGTPAPRGTPAGNDGPRHPESRPTGNARTDPGHRHTGGARTDGDGDGRRRPPGSGRTDGHGASPDRIGTPADGDDASPVGIVPAPDDRSREAGGTAGPDAGIAPHKGTVSDQGIAPDDGIAPGEGAVSDRAGRAVPTSARPPRGTGDGAAGRRAAGPVRAVPEAYVWCNLTSGNGARALWLFLLPFMVVNLAHWMRPASRGRRRTVRCYGLLVRLTGLTLTVLLVAAACEVALDLTAWQCAGTDACAARHTWLGFLSPAASHDGWWSSPGRRLALAAAVPAALTWLLWYLSRRTWNAYESQQPLDRRPEPDEDTDHTALDRPGFWYGRRLVARLRAAHTAAGLLTVAAALTAPALSHDRAPGGSAVLGTLGLLLAAGHLAAALVVIGVVCRRGRSENRLDRHLDAHLVRRLPLAALALLLLAALHAGWSRPGWQSDGRLPGGTAFGTLALGQGALVVALAVAARTLHATRPDRRSALRGLGGPAVAMLSCALGGVMSGGVSQRVSDWLDGTGSSIPGPPVLLTWQASIIPALLVVVLAICGHLARRAWRLRRAELVTVALDHPGEPEDPARTHRIATTRAMATLTDRAPLLVGATSATTLLLGAGALVGAFTTGRTPDAAARPTVALVHGAAQTSQALGSWLIGFGFILFVTWGRRAYKDAAARRTIGILWDVGTFWPRAAHPFAPPCYAERAVPDLTWRIATWTRATGGRLVLSGHSQGSVLAAAAAWQLPAQVRARIALLTYGCPLERLYGRWFPAHFGPDALGALHRDVDCWRNLYRLTDPIGGPVRLPGDCGPEVDRPPLKDPLSYGRTATHPLPAPILGHSDYQADPAFAEERARLLARLAPALPGPRPEEPAPAQTDSGRSSP